mgnify:CR=1 FL=1
MPDDVSGNYSLPPSYFVQDGDTVLPEQHNPPFEDVASAMSNRIHKDGRTLWTGNQNANGHKITGLANGVALTDAANVGQAVAASTPIGSVVDYAGITAPTNWLFCYGQAISRTTYAALFAVIGTAWGAGNGTTTFNLPDCRGRAAIGKDDMGGTAANRITTAGAGFDGSTIAAAGGTQTHTLTTAQIPVHNHTASSASAGSHSHTGTAASAGNHAHTGTTVADGNHAHSGTTADNGNHQHTYSAPQATIFFGGGGGQNIPSIVTGNTSAGGTHAHTFNTNTTGNHSHDFTTSTTGAHTHSVTTTTDGAHTHTITVNNAGSGEAHLNVQPSIVFNKIIRVA